MVIRHAPVGLCLLDREFRYLWVNETLARYNGRSVEEHLGASARETVPEISDEMASLAQRVLDTGEPLLDREVSARPPGDPEHEYTWLLNLHPVRAAEGAARAIMVALQDVTRLKRAQRASFHRRTTSFSPVAVCRALDTRNSQRAQTLSLRDVVSDPWLRPSLGFEVSKPSEASPCNDSQNRPSRRCRNPKTIASDNCGQKSFRH